MVDSTTYQEIEDRLTKRKASGVASKLVTNYANELVPFFTSTYDNPMGQLPPAVLGALEVIENEVYTAALRQAKDKLQRKLIEGMEALLDA